MWATVSQQVSEISDQSLQEMWSVRESCEQSSSHVDEHENPLARSARCQPIWLQEVLTM